MKKNYLFIGLISTITVSGISYQLYQESFASDITKSSILLEKNVEALARNETPPATCGTKEELISGVSCPGHSHKIGFKGTEYSYSKNGLDSSYKSGKKGTMESCPVLGNPPEPVNDVKEYNCSNK